MNRKWPEFSRISACVTKGGNGEENPPGLKFRYEATTQRIGSGDEESSTPQHKVGHRDLRPGLGTIPRGVPARSSHSRPCARHRAFPPSRSKRVVGRHDCETTSEKFPR